MHGKLPEDAWGMSVKCSSTGGLGANMQDMCGAGGGGPARNKAQEPLSSRKLWRCAPISQRGYGHPSVGIGRGCFPQMSHPLVQEACQHFRPSGLAVDLEGGFGTG